MKQLSLNKYLKLTLTLTLLISLVMLTIGGLATHRQDDFNKTLIWDAGTKSARTLNGFGVAFAIIGWGFFQLFTDAKSPKSWYAYIGILFTLLGTIFINGILGLIGGSLAVALMITIFVLIVTRTNLPLWTFKGLNFKKFTQKKVTKKGGKK